MKKLLVKGLTLGFLALPLSVGAEEIVCVNGDELLKESHYAQELKQEIIEKRKELMEKYQKKAQEIAQKLKKIQEEVTSGLLSAEAQKQKREEYVKLQQELQTLQFQAQQEAQKFIAEQLQKLDSLTKAALKALAKVKGFKAALDCNSLLYYSKNIDITPEVAKIVDQLAPKEGNETEKK